MAKSERVLRMIDDFMPLHDEGYSIPQIAGFYQLAPHTVYEYLQEIADKHGVERKSLLQRVRTQTTKAALLSEERKVRINVEELKAEFATAKSSIEKICSKIDHLLEKEEATSCQR